MKFAFFPLLIVLSFSANSQGFIFDSTGFNKAPELSIERGILPESYSLERYLPILYPQKGGTCVAMSFALARTMQFAMDNNLSDSKKISAYYMSPYFLYYLARDASDLSCGKGLNPLVVGQIAKKYGFEFMANVEYDNYYPFTASKLCPNDYDFFPPELQTHVKNAQKNRINEVYTIKSIDHLKSAISHGLPVIIGMQISKSFTELRSSIWKPLYTENKTLTLWGHAVVAIAYNDDLLDGCVLIANSWGDTWGDNGKAWIRYNDLRNWMDGGFVMEPEYNNYKYEFPTSAETKSAKLKSQIFESDQYDRTIKFDNSKIIEAFKIVEKGKN